jgi:DNA-binding GntR family transcriptional regulator
VLTQFRFLVTMDKTSPIHITLTEREPSVTITQWVYLQLRTAVMQGEILPGRALTIRELAALLGVSNMPVREALRQLGAEQALEIRETRRVMVPKMTRAKFDELCKARIALETHAAERALPFITRDTLAELIHIDQHIDQAQAQKQWQDANRLNQHFHRTLYQANPNPVMLPLIESIWLQLGPFMRLAQNQLQSHYETDHHHEALSAIRDNDAISLKHAIELDIHEGLALASSPEFLNCLTQ